MVYFYPISSYGWNSLGLTSLLDKCHQKGLTFSVLIEITWWFCVWSKIAMGKYQLEGVPKFSVKNWQ